MRDFTLADGQVAATAGTILAGSELPTNGGKITATFHNAGSTTETLIVSLKVSGGTARRKAQAILYAKETLVINAMAMQPDDTLLAATTNATTVDYTIDGKAEGPFSVYTLDSNGAIKNGASAIGSGNQTISGDLTVSGGDVDCGSSGAAGTVDIFPATASKGKVSLTAANSTGDTTTTIVNAEQAGARTYTIPDAGASSSFVMLAGEQTLSGAKTFTGGVVVTTAGVTITDVNVALGTTTGTKIGTATSQKLAFYNSAPVVQPGAYTQTYATADKTHANLTAAALTVADGAGTNDGTIGAITGDASVIAAVQELAAQVNKLVTDLTDVKQLVNSVIDDLQSLGLVG